MWSVYYFFLNKSYIYMIVKWWGVLWYIYCNKLLCIGRVNLEKEKPERHWNLDCGQKLFLFKLGMGDLITFSCGPKVSQTLPKECVCVWARDILAPYQSVPEMIPTPVVSHLKLCLHQALSFLSLFPFLIFSPSSSLAYLLLHPSPLPSPSWPSTLTCDWGGSVNSDVLTSRLAMG